jgi:hypothetical protein
VRAKESGSFFEMGVSANGLFCPRKVRKRIAWISGLFADIGGQPNISSRTFADIGHILVTEHARRAAQGAVD